MTPSSAQSVSKTRPLSYAERAKKAQNIKSPVASLSTRFTNPPPTPSSVTTTFDQADAVSDFPPPALSAADTDSVPSTLSSSGMNPHGVNAVNGSSPSTKSLASAALSIVAAHSAMQKPPPPPPVNVWNVRKMAQAQQSQLKSPTVSYPSPNSSLPQSAAQLAPKSSASAHDNDSAAPSRRPPDPRPNGSNQRPFDDAKVPSNGLAHSSPNDNDDPFVVRVFPRSHRPPAPAQPVLQPPSIHDTDSWPEVGKAPSNGSHPHPGTSVPDGTREKHGEGEDSRETLSTATPRKSEKTKWVPIPAEELQATADAIRSSMHQTHSRNHSTLRQSGHSRNNAPSSGSASSVQGHSRTQSGRNSLTHSQAHSRASSAHSSPRHANRGRRLPIEEPVGSNPFEVVDRRSPLVQNDASIIPASLISPPYVPVPDQLTSGAAYFPNISQAVPMQPFPQDLRQRMAHSALLGNYSLAPDFSSLASIQPPHLQPTQQAFPGVTLQPYPLYSSFTNFDPTQLLLYGSRQHSPSFHPPVPVYPPQLSIEPQPQPLSSLDKTKPSASGSSVPPSVTSTAPVDVKAPEAPAEPRLRAVVFGSIGVPGSSKGPSPSPHSGDGESKPVESHDDGVEKVFPSFSVGVAPGEPGPSRIKPGKIRRRTETTPGRIVSDDVVAEAVKEDDVKEVQKRVIDLTGTKWAFGTIKSPVANPVELRIGGEELPVPSPDQVASEANAEEVAGTSPGTPPAHLTETIPSPQLSVRAPLPHVQINPLVVPSTIHGSQLVSPINGLSLAAPFPMQRTTIPTLSSSPTDGYVSTNGPEWEVKNFGYGFGNGGPSIVQDEREAEKERERLEKESLRERELTGRPRRGSYGGGYVPYDRGGFGGRRGRTAVSGGYNGGAPRTYNAPRIGRGAHHTPQSSVSAQQPLRQPFTITPPPVPFAPLSPVDPPVPAFYAPRQPLTTYISTGYETLQPAVPVPAPLPGAPVPVPLSTVPFPLDPMRTYLLGQLEYYLSPQNMAQDFFLRQRMDSRGWIPISLIASFNRVRWLTTDSQVVKEVLALSTMVEVKDEFVRMSGWEQFVLPDAPASAVENPTVYYPDPRNFTTTEMSNPGAEAAAQDGEEDVEDVDVEDDEEEEVVFVLDREEESWSPERRHV